MGSEDIMQYLAELGMDVNIADMDGNTALHHAAHDGRLTLVTFLVEKCGANMYAKNKYGKTPRHQTCSIEVAKYLDDWMMIPRKHGVEEDGEGNHVDKKRRSDLLLMM
jgi:ankyrin repeat protein